MALDFATAYIRKTGLGSEWDLVSNTTRFLYSTKVYIDALPTGGANMSLFALNNAGISEGIQASVKPGGDAIIYTWGANSGTISAGFSAGSWLNVIVVYDQVADKLQLYLDSTTAVYDPASYTDNSASTSNAFCLGAENYLGNMLNGKLADTVVCNLSAAVTADQIAALLDGVSPLLVFPLSDIVDYFPFINGDLNGVKGFTGWTESGTLSASDHPPIYMPAGDTPSYLAVAAAAGEVINPYNIVGNGGVVGYGSNIIGPGGTIG